MHILIIPPEEFTPAYAPLSGIFQYHQATALANNGVQTGVISVTKPVSILPGMISFFRKLTGRKVYYKVLEDKSILQIASIIIRQFISSVNVEYGQISGVNVLRIQCRWWNDSGAEGEFAYFKYCIQRAAPLYKKKFGIPQLIHAHNAWLAGSSALELSELWKIPFGITEHSTFYARNLIPHPFYPELNRCYNASAFNLVVSHSLGELLKKLKLLSDNYRYLPNMLDPLFEQATPVAKEETESFVFLTIGELTEKKAQDILLRSFSKSFKGNNHVQLRIGGSGDMVSVLKQIVIDEGISSQVTFTGVLDRKQVLDQMLNCNVFVLPSLHETFGVVLIEAMAVGKPVIATRSGGPETFVHAENGLLISPGNSNELSKAMEFFYRKERTFDSSAIRNEVLQHFGSKKVATSLINIYSKVIASAND